MANVSFKFGTKAKYTALETKDENTLYWLLDTQELYRGDVLFGVGAEATKEAAGLLSAEDKAKLDELVENGIIDLVPVNGGITIESEAGVGKIGVAVSEAYGNIITIKDDGIFASEKYTIERQPESSEGYAVTYRLKRTTEDGSEFVGDTIDIPKDLVLQGGSFEIAKETDDPYEGAEIGDPYIDLVLNDEDSTHIYIPLKGVVDTVEAGQGIQVENNVVSVKLNADITNGLTITDDGLGLSLATAYDAGAMSAVDKKFLDSIPVLYDEVKYDFFSTPVGTLINNQGKEYRIMIPAGTQWTKQDSNNNNPNYNPNNYYIAFRAYAPDDGVVGFKESLKQVVDDPKLYRFVADDFGGVDKYGRKYSVVWLPVAAYDNDTDSWTYYGEKSKDGKYIGWYYSVEWYDGNNNVVASDTIKINLTNEKCHNSVLPFYMNEYATTEDIEELQDGLTWGEM